MRQTILVSFLALAACKTAPEVVADVTPPSVPAEDFVVVTQSLTQVDVKYTGTIAAGSEAVTVEKAVWEFVVDGTVKRSGEDKLGLAAAAGQTVDFALDESLTYVKDEEELKAMDARGGSLLLALRGTLVITVPVAASGDKPAGKRTVELPFARSREVKTPRLPHLKMIEFEAGRFSENEVQAIFHLGVVNPNNFQIAITGLDYTATLAGKAVATGTIGAGERVTQASTGVFDITATLNEETHGKDAAKIVKALIIPWVLKSSLRAQLYSEEMESKGDIKLKASK
ncbi:MAG: LEA type 2 family protein [Archangium sp.]|nr:LEA type 2 family protein [Archangium sp.]